MVPLREDGNVDMESADNFDMDLRLSNSEKSSFAIPFKLLNGSKDGPPVLVLDLVAGPQGSAVGLAAPVAGEGAQGSWLLGRDCVEETLLDPQGSEVADVFVPKDCQGSKEAGEAAVAPQGSGWLFDVGTDAAAQGSDFGGAGAPGGSASIRSNNDGGCWCCCDFFFGALVVAFLLSSRAI